MSGDSSQTNPIVTAPNAPQIDQRALVGLPPADSQQEDKGLTFLKALKYVIYDNLIIILNFIKYSINLLSYPFSHHFFFFKTVIITST